MVATIDGIGYSAFGHRLEGTKHRFINVTAWRDPLSVDVASSA